jgi:hypothetical protein
MIDAGLANNLSIEETSVIQNGSFSEMKPEQTSIRKKMGKLPVQIIVSEKAQDIKSKANGGRFTVIGLTAASRDPVM